MDDDDDDDEIGMVEWTVVDGGISVISSPVE